LTFDLSTPKTIPLLGYPKDIPYTKFEHYGIVCFWVMLQTDRLGTCELVRNFEIWFEFESDDSDLIWKWRAVSKFQPRSTHLPYHKPCSLFNKKNFNRCAAVIEIYFMFMILCLCIKYSTNKKQNIHDTTVTFYNYNVACSRVLPSSCHAVGLHNCGKRHWTRKRLHSDSIPDSNLSLRFDSWFDSWFDSNEYFRFAGPYDRQTRNSYQSGVISSIWCNSCIQKNQHHDLITNTNKLFHQIST